MIPPGFLGKIAGAVQDDDEWIIVYSYKVYENGMRIIIDDMWVPKTQVRTGGHVVFDESKERIPARMNGKPLGNIHSHNNMGKARFSGTDFGEGGVCYNYSSAIVVSSRWAQEDKDKQVAAQLLGFSYQAVVRGPLPCGARGRFPALIIPIGYTNWPVENRNVIRADHERVVKDLGDCRRYHSSPETDEYHLQRLGNCKVTEEALKVRTGIFGYDDSLIDEMPVAKKYENLVPAGNIIRVGYDRDTYDSREYIDDDEAYIRWLRANAATDGIHTRDTDEIPIITPNMLNGASNALVKREDKEK